MITPDQHAAIQAVEAKLHAQTRIIALFPAAYRRARDLAELAALYRALAAAYRPVGWEVLATSAELDAATVERLIALEAAQAR